MPSRYRYSLLGAHFTRSCDVIHYVTNRFAIGQFLVVVHWNLSFAVLRYLHLNITGSRPWHFEVTWCYRSCEILGPKHFGITTLTFVGHVTSSVSWPIDSPQAICYWLSIETEALSLNVFEIFDPKIQCAHTRHTDRHTPRVSLWMYCIGQTKIIK